MAAKMPADMLVTPLTSIDFTDSSASLYNIHSSSSALSSHHQLKDSVDATMILGSILFVIELQIYGIVCLM